MAWFLTSAPFVFEGDPLGVFEGGGDSIVNREMPGLMAFSSGGQSAMVNVKGTKGFFQSEYHFVAPLSQRPVKCLLYSVILGRRGSLILSYPV